MAHLHELHVWLMDHVEEYKTANCMCFSGFSVGLSYADGVSFVGYSSYIIGEHALFTDAIHVSH